MKQYTAIPYIHRYFFRSTIFILFFSFLVSCGTVPILGRRQMLLVSHQEVLSLSAQEYTGFIGKAKVDKASENAKMVKRVGEKISSAVEEFMIANGLEAEVGSFNWEFNYVLDPTVNAFCMPGGKIVFYEGILNVMENENDLATVMSHEVAHAVAKHSNERMSQRLLVDVGGQVVDVVVSEKSEMTQQIAGMAFGMGAQYGLLLPYSRKHESEADELGLYFMAMAGYDPSRADEFWIRMAAAGGEKPPEIMSTHPSDEKRIKRIRAAVPKVLAYMQADTNKRQKVKMKRH